MQELSHQGLKRENVRLKEKSEHMALEVAMGSMNLSLQEDAKLGGRFSIMARF